VLCYVFRVSDLSNLLNDCLILMSTRRATLRWNLVNILTDRQAGAEHTVQASQLHDGLFTTFYHIPLHYNAIACRCSMHNVPQIGWPAFCLI
jgi:hypothetical protein